jgi:hypothetical protein
LTSLPKKEIFSNKFFSDPPNPPIFLTHRGSSFQSTVKWVPVNLENANGAPVTKYKLSRCTQNTNCADKTIIYEGMPNTESLGGIEFMEFSDNVVRPPNIYKYFISAKNQAALNDGWGEESVYTVTPPNTRPDDVRDVRHGSIESEGTIVPIYWTEPKYNNGKEVNYYRINVHTGHFCDSVDISSTPEHYIGILKDNFDKYCTSSNTNLLSCTYRLQTKPSTSYCVAIYAKNGLPETVPGGAFSPMRDTSKVFFTTGKARPGPVCLLNETYVGQELVNVVQKRNGIEFGWVKPRENGDRIQHYQVFISEAGSATEYYAGKVDGSENRNLKIISSSSFKMNSDTVYNVKVTATNALGTSSCCPKNTTLSDEDSNGNSTDCKYFVLQTGKPGVPDRVNKINILSYTGFEIKLGWEEPYDGHSTILRYIIKMTKKGDTKTVEKCLGECLDCTTSEKTSCPNLETTFIASGLRAHTAYDFEVVAENAVGRSTSTKVSQTTSSPNPPGPVHNLTYEHRVNVGRSWLEVFFYYPSPAEGGDGGSDITKYEIMVSSPLMKIINHPFSPILHSQGGLNAVAHKSSTLSFDGQRYKFRVNNLNGEEKHIITVTTWNIQGKGENSKNISIITLSPCEAGQHLTEVGEQCLKCQIGRFSASKNVALECDLCPVGRYQKEKGSVACKLCERGKVSSADRLGTECNDCSLGKFADTPALGKCKQCSAGKYAEKLGMSLCNVCPENTYRLEPEATELRQCLSCQNNAETLRSTQMTGAFLKTQCTCSTGFYSYGKQGNDPLDPLLECKSCPDGAKCTATSVGHVLDAAMGYWTPNTTNTHPEKRFYKCPLDGCLGGDHKVGGSKSNCDIGYEGVCCAGKFIHSIYIYTYML